MARAPSTLLARLGNALGPDAAAVRQTTAALGVSAGTSLVAGLALGAATTRLEQFPGLLLLVPAAIGLRGNIFGALGSRLGTAIHTGTFNLSRRRDTVVGQNVLASMVLTLSMSLGVAVLAKVVGAAFGLTDTVPVADLVTISVLGGVGASLVILGITLLLSAQAVRSDWDLDIVSGPLVSASGDLVTLPALVAATYAVGSRRTSTALAVACTIASVAALAWVVRTRLPELRRIVRESVPVLLVAGLLNVVAGITFEKRLVELAALPALLVLIPGFLSSAGSLGSILSARLSTRLHLGLTEPSAVPDRGARSVILAVLALSLPTFVLTALAVEAGAALAGLEGPGVALLVGVAVLGGLLTMVLVVPVAYYGSVAAVRVGLDPDTYGIPLVTSTLDLVGALSLVLAILALGIT